MVFEVKATHWMASTGVAVCEVHPDVFVDEWGRLIVTNETVAENASVSGGIRPIDPQDHHDRFVVADDAIELVIDWVEVLSRSARAGHWIEERTRRRWVTTPESAPRLRSDIDRASLRGDRRTVAFDVRASHRLKSGGELACEIYPDVFLGQRGREAYSRLAGMAMQQPGDFVDALPDGTQEWFTVRNLRHAIDWVSTAARLQDEYWLEQHGSWRRSGVSIGPMGPSCPPRRPLPPLTDDPTESEQVS